ncbi:unnamed protein product [Lota lota]
MEDGTGSGGEAGRGAPDGHISRRPCGRWGIFMGERGPENSRHGRERGRELPAAPHSPYPTPTLSCGPPDSTGPQILIRCDSSLII